IGTAVGAYLMRDDDQAHSDHAERAPRTFDNAHIRDSSWPCVLVMVRDWVQASGFGGTRSKFAPQDMVPKMLFMPDGRMVPVCVVQVTPTDPVAAAPAPTRWPNSYIGAGFPLTIEAQGERRRASVGCLVTDGHTVYAVTNRHVCGPEGTPVFTETRGGIG